MAGSKVPSERVTGKQVQTWKKKRWTRWLQDSTVLEEELESWVRMSMLRD